MPRAEQHAARSRLSVSTNGLSLAPSGRSPRDRHFSFIGAGILLVLMLLDDSRELAAQDTVGGDSQPAIRVARLVERLASSDFDQRVAAREELESLGEITREEIELATRSDDLEVRLQAQELLRKLKIRRLWSASSVAYKSDTSQPASVVFESLAGQTGNRLLLGDQYGTFQDASVKLDTQEQPFWAALDQVCEQSGNHVRPHYDTSRPGLVVVSGAPGCYPVAYAGPVRAQITNARRVFTEDFDYEHLKSETTHTFQLNLQIMWEDRFRLVAYRSPPRVVEVVTDDGDELAATQPSGSAWNVAGSSNRRLSMDLRLHPPSTASSKLDRLRLEWDLIAVGDMAAIDVTDLSKPSEHRQDDLSLRVDEIEEKQGSRYEVTVWVVRDLVVPEPQDVLFQEIEVELFDQDGEAFRHHGQTNALTDDGARMRLTFGSPSSGSKPNFLRLAYPRVRSQHALQIEFRDVQLPVKRPD